MKNKDLDNIAKTILDALNGIAYEDDKQIVELHCEKYYTSKNTEYVEVKIETLANDFVTIEHLKNKAKNEKLFNRYMELRNKEKLTKTEQNRLNELRQILLKEGILYE